jgi:glycosyltransferase involved in cell wall biosynthesis
MPKKKLVAAFCTYNRSDRLPLLITRLRQQECPIDFEILVINNNSTDNTKDVLNDLANQPGKKLLHVIETQQGIPYARNRAITESFDADYLYFMDDDELPKPGLLTAAIDALEREGADCVGGGVINYFEPNQRPHWLDDSLLGFLAETDHGQHPFWIKNDTTPIWTANVAYRMQIFRNDESLRFDIRYNRIGKGIGGGSDLKMFEDILTRKMKIRYRPDMVVEHFVEQWRLSRRYFLKLHFLSGRRTALYEFSGNYKTLMGIPYFMFVQLFKQSLSWLSTTIKRKPGSLRQGMNATYAAGMIYGCALKHYTNKK